MMDETNRKENKWNSQSLSESIIEFFRALRESGREGKWPESQDGDERIY
jgi:hypothetical protein